MDIHMDTQGHRRKRTETAGNKKRLPPVSIPLDFETAVQGLLAVDPKEPIEQSKAAKKKPRPKK
jgi:hypothetical protein